MSFDLNRCAIAVLMVMLPAFCSCAQASKAGLVRTGFPGEDAGLLAAISKQLTQAGYQVGEVDLAGLCDRTKLTVANYDLLVIPDGSTLPAAAVGPVESYLKTGGDIIVLNAPLWQRAVVNVGGRWVTQAEYQAQHSVDLPEHVLFAFEPSDIEGWSRETASWDQKTISKTIASGPAPGQRSLHVVIPKLLTWDTTGTSKIAGAFPNGDTLTVFSAKGGPKTTQLAVEWREKDGSRWIAVIPLTTEWRQYILRPQDFKFWESVPGRGGKDDCFKPENADGLFIGLSQSHTGSVGTGRQEYWVGPFGTAKATPEMAQVLAAHDAPALDTLSPSYKFFDCSDVAKLTLRADQGFGGAMSLELPSSIRSPHPRASGGGYAKGRDWRWIGLVEAQSAKDQWRGTPVTLTVNAAGPYRGGVWASFGIADVKWYKTPGSLKLIGQVAERIRRGVFLVDGGAYYYTYFEGQPVKLGVRAANLERRDAIDVTARVTVMDGARQVFSKQWPTTIVANGEATSECDWQPEEWPKTGYKVTAEILSGGQVIDRVTHDIHVWEPKAKKQFVTIKDGQFVLDGTRWRMNAVNYMPSSGIATEDYDYFENWFGARAYDPEVIQRDLDHCKDMGFNSTSVFINDRAASDQNLLDYLRRSDELGLKANVSLRPGTPMDFLWDRIRPIIEYNRLAENDTVFAYDLAWEPAFGTHESRTIWDGEWEKWIVERYDSVANAERNWGYPVPRDDSGKITNPFPEHFVGDGKWNPMTAAYRRFTDTLLYKKYGAARRLVRGVDPNHLVSFRMSEAGNPTLNWPGHLFYDFPYLAGAVDFLAPEAYSRNGDWENVKPGWFEFEYARWAAPDKPMIWSEHGFTTWDNSRMANSPDLLKTAADTYTDFYNMLIKSGASGVAHWWYPGGFRPYEKSDFGIINPDGTDREVTRVIRDFAPKFLNGPSAKPVSRWILIDRDSQPDGVSGIYSEVKSEFWRAIEEGQTPGLKTEGTGTESTNCPTTGVGNMPHQGEYPFKYLDAAFDVVEAQDAEGKWVEVVNGSTVKVQPGKPLMMRVSVTNLGEAAWAPKPGIDSVGVVYLLAGDTKVTLGSRVPHLGSLQLKNVQVSAGNIDSVTAVTLVMVADRLAKFGERFTLKLIR